MAIEPNSKNVKVNNHLINLSLKFVGNKKTYPSLSQFVNQALRNELEKRGVKV